MTLLVFCSQASPTNWWVCSPTIHHLSYTLLLMKAGKWWIVGLHTHQLAGDAWLQNTNKVISALDFFYISSSCSWSTFDRQCIYLRHPKRCPLSWWVTHSSILCWSVYQSRIEKIGIFAIQSNQIESWFVQWLGWCSRSGGRRPRRAIRCPTFV